MKSLKKEVYGLERVLKRVKLINGEEENEVSNDLNIKWLEFYNESDDLVKTYIKYRNYLREEINKYKV